VACKTQGRLSSAYEINRGGLNGFARGVGAVKQFEDAGALRRREIYEFDPCAASVAVTNASPQPGEADRLVECHAGQGNLDDLILFELDVGGKCEALARNVE
jgi:hypothetical protein